MPLQGGRVVRALVPEEFAEAVERDRLVDQPVPVVVPALVAEVTQQRPVRFAELQPSPLPFGIIGFDDVDRDHAIGMPREDRAGAFHKPIGVRQELEGQALGMLVILRDHWQTEC